MLEIKREFEDQSKKEAEFFDKFYKEADEKHRLENYLISEEIIRQITQPTPNSLNHIEYASSLLGNLKGKKLLDYGAGDGWTAICFAKGGARVWAIDISEKGVELIKKKAAANGVDNLVTAEVQNCYKTRFESDKFDIIFGGGILHHLDIEGVGKELNRIIHIDGRWRGCFLGAHKRNKNNGHY